MHLAVRSGVPNSCRAWLIHRSVWKYNCMLKGRHRANYDYKSVSDSDKIAVSGAQSGVRTDTNGVFISFPSGTYSGSSHCARVEPGGLLHSISSEPGGMGALSRVAPRLSAYFLKPDTPDTLVCMEGRLLLQTALDPYLCCAARRSAARKDRVLTQDVVDPDNVEPRYMEKHGVDLHQRRGLHQFRRIAVKAVLTPSSPLSSFHTWRIDHRREGLDHSGVTERSCRPSTESKS